MINSVPKALLDSLDIHMDSLDSNIDDVLISRFSDSWAISSFPARGDVFSCNKKGCQELSPIDSKTRYV